jgi:hypothetical protein
VVQIICLIITAIASVVIALFTFPNVDTFTRVISICFGVWFSFVVYNFIVELRKEREVVGLGTVFNGENVSVYPKSVA